jgi:adenine phosphoribosyltransferase
MAATGGTVDWRRLVREIPDFPQPGVLFRDVLPALADPEAFRAVVQELADAASPFDADLVVAPEARGFLLAGALAVSLGAGVVAVRKPGKLPGPVLAQEYALEYGHSRLEVEALPSLRGRSGLILDDVLATGGTVEATAALMAQLGIRVAGLACLLELASLGGRARLPFPVAALWTV